MPAWRRRGRGAQLGEIEAVYRRRLGEFRRVAAAITGERELARDVVQDAFVAAVRRCDQFRQDGPIEAWLWRIVVNQARTARRAGRGEVAEALAVHPSGNGRADDDLAHVGLALATLPERQRLVLFLRYYADLDYETIATVAGIAPGTVGATLNAGRRALRRLVEEVPT